MIKLFSLKQQKKDGESTTRSGTQKKASAAQLRITKGYFCLNVIDLLHRKELSWFYNCRYKWIKSA